MISKLKISDYKYLDVTLSQFVNNLMVNGKKFIALNIVYKALDKLGKSVEEDVISAFHTAVNNVKPSLEVKSRRVGSATYQVPIEISQKRQQTLAMSWIIMSARKRSGKSMAEKLAAELIDAYKSTGQAYKKMEETHRMAEANKAFSHYKW